MFQYQYLTARNKLHSINLTCHSNHADGMFAAVDFVYRVFVSPLVEKKTHAHNLEWLTNQFRILNLFYRDDLAHRFDNTINWSFVTRTWFKMV